MKSNCNGIVYGSQGEKCAMIIAECDGIWLLFACTRCPLPPHCFKENIFSFLSLTNVSYKKKERSPLRLAWLCCGCCVSLMLSCSETGFSCSLLPVLLGKAALTDPFPKQLFLLLICPVRVKFL